MSEIKKMMNPENLKTQKEKIKSNKMNNQIQSFQSFMKIRFYKNNLYK